MSEHPSARSDSGRPGFNREDSMDTNLEGVWIA